MHNKDHYYLSNNILNNEYLNQRNKNICEFWSQSDTINIKKTINMNGNYKHPEPIDIDADLQKIYNIINLINLIYVF